MTWGLVTSYPVDTALPGLTLQCGQDLLCSSFLRVMVSSAEGSLDLDIQKASVHLAHTQGFLIKTLRVTALWQGNVAVLVFISSCE